jgi:hypothetical protein
MDSLEKRLLNIESQLNTLINRAVLLQANLQNLSSQVSSTPSAEPVVEPTLVFIIAYVYNKNYTSYINHYIENINAFYKNVSILIVDNYPDNVDKFDIISAPNIIMLTNNTNCILELGAYKVGLNYLNTTGLVYDYCILTQESFIIKNRYDFNTLKNNSVKACTIYSGIFSPSSEYESIIITNVLNSINMNNNFENIRLCWCNNFILHHSVVSPFLSITKDILIKDKFDSGACERFLGRILYELNEHKNFDIDGDQERRRYDCWTINLFNPIQDHYFAKRVQMKPVIEAIGGKKWNNAPPLVNS